MMPIYYVDGQFVRADAATLPVNDLALLRGYAVFDVLRAYDGHLFRLREHVQRLFESAKLIHLAHQYTIDNVMQIIRDTYVQNNMPNALVRTVLTGGDGIDSITPAGQARLLVYVLPHTIMTEAEYVAGVKIITTLHERFMPTAKTIHYIPAIMAMREAREQEAVEAVYVDKEGYVSEATRSSLFAFINGRLVTADEGVLGGITRQVVLTIADGVYPISLRPIRLNELYNAAEVFLASTTKEILPVVHIDTHTIGTGIAGSQTLDLLRRFRQEVAQACQAHS